MTDWPALLDAIDEGLTSSPPVIVDFVPAGYGALPAALAARAAATLERMAAAEAALVLASAEIGRELATLAATKTMATSAPSVPHFLDTKA